MPRKLIGGLIHTAAPVTDPAVPIDKIRKAAIDAHIPLIEEAGRQGVQILGLQEVFNGPYFCPSQDPHWYDIAEAPWNSGRFYGSSYFVDPRGKFLAVGSEDKDELVIAEMDLDVIEDVRRVWQFYRDRRPETYGSMAEQLP